ncbi:MAG: DUF1707 domain-containing protein [Pseudonocardia sp.]|nr:DUF1707 domain-containing protein [Pseudonocardia sp.]
MNEPVKPDAMRVSDVDRTFMQERLRRAHEVGALDLNEFDERVAAVWASRTRADLVRTVADLPAPPRTRNHGVVFADSAGGKTMRVLTIIWACVSAVALVSWGIVVLSDGGGDPWWMWVAGPPAAVLLVLYVAGIGRSPRLGG